MGKGPYSEEPCFSSKAAETQWWTIVGGSEMLLETKETKGMWYARRIIINMCISVRRGESASGNKYQIFSLHTSKFYSNSKYHRQKTRHTWRCHKFQRWKVLLLEPNYLSLCADIAISMQEASPETGWHKCEQNRCVEKRTLFTYLWKWNMKAFNILQRRVIH